jgi:hypothetical protein
MRQRTQSTQRSSNRCAYQRGCRHNSYQRSCRCLSHEHVEANGKDLRDANEAKFVPGMVFRNWRADRIRHLGNGLLDFRFLLRNTVNSGIINVWIVKSTS